MYWKDLSLARTLLMAGSLTGILLAATPSRAQDDPPPGSARFALLYGNVSIQPNGLDSWGQAAINMPAGPGDRIYTDQGGRGELQVSTVRCYFGDHADLTLVNNTYHGVELGLAQGEVTVVSDGFPPGGGLTVQTPNGAISISGRAYFRVEVYPDLQSTVITNDGNMGDLSVNGGGGFYTALAQNQSVQLTGANPVYAQPLQAPPRDALAEWASNYETLRSSSLSARYVNTELPGYQQLDAAGDWQPQSDYGPIWFPHVQAGWAPYHFGHWVHMAFFGWTWVADEPWGAAPFHYGRWVTVGGRWGWIPGPREGHPIWSPAQVVFAGGIQVGGVGVSVWFPLGPGEPYKPWYPCSPQYINQINISNIHESSVVHVQTNYVNIVNVTNVTYVNRTVGVTAMRQEDFAAGRSSANVSVTVNVNLLAHVQPARPEARPPAQPVILHPVARPAGVPQQRPVLINSKGQQAVASPNAKPIPVPVSAAQPAPKPIPGRAAIGAPSLGGKPVAAPAKTAAQPAKPEIAKPAPPPAKAAGEPAKAAAPASKASPGSAKATTPAAKSAVEPAKAPPEPANTKPQPAVKTQTAPPEAKPAEHNEAKPAPETKDDRTNDDKAKDSKKKDQKKKEDEKTAPPKPE